MMNLISGIMRGISGKLTVSAENMAARAAKFDAGATIMAQREAAWSAKALGLQTKVGDSFTSMSTKVGDDIAQHKAYAQSIFGTAKNTAGDVKDVAVASFQDDLSRSFKLTEKDAKAVQKTKDFAKGTWQQAKQGVTNYFDARAGNRTLTQLNKTVVSDLGSTVKKMTPEQHADFIERARAFENNPTILPRLAKEVLQGI